MPAAYPSFDRLVELQQLIARFAQIERVPHLADLGRKENDVEHSFGLALTCWYLHAHIAPELSLEKILSYALAHDIVEIHAGDTFVFDEEGKATKEERETSAVKAIREKWRDFPELSDFAEGYMLKKDEEARFVKAVDKVLPVIMVDLGEKDAFWKRHHVTLEMERDNKKSILVSDIVAPYYVKLIDWLDKNNYIPKS